MPFFQSELHSTDWKWRNTYQQFCWDLLIFLSWIHWLWVRCFYSKRTSIVVNSVHINQSFINDSVPINFMSTYLHIWFIFFRLIAISYMTILFILTNFKVIVIYKCNIFCKIVLYDNLPWLKVVPIEENCSSWPIFLCTIW